MNIAVVGYGVEGASLVQYFLKKGHQVTVLDSQKKEVKEKAAHTRFGPTYLQKLDDFDLIFRSPGVPYTTPEFNSVREKLTSLTKYFLEHCPATIIGVTGTKGKGTVSTLIYEMLKEAGSSAKGNNPTNGGSSGISGNVFLGGNIGVSPIEFLDGIRADDFVVLEMSSFQLQDITQSPNVSVVLGISPDHMDHHTSMEEYVDAKRNIVKFQKKSDAVVLDIDNNISAEFAKSTPATIYKVSIQKTLNDEGGFIKVGSLVLNVHKTGMIIGSVSDIALPGEHNIKNILCAAVAAAHVNVAVEVITKVVREFRGLPHRLEFVKEVDGVRYYDDSASTNPETAMAAIRAFPDRPLILIAGGSDKKVPFDVLGEAIAKQENVKTVILMGETRGLLERAIERACSKEEQRKTKNPLELILAESYQEAFMVGRLLAKSGDTVVLSPACASFDMFANFKERGDIFREFVKNL